MILAFFNIERATARTRIPWEPNSWNDLKSFGGIGARVKVVRSVKGAVSEMLNATAEICPPLEPTFRSFLASTFQSFTSFRNEQFHLMALPNLLRSDSHCIDIGAHNGKFLHHILRFSPDGTHIAFEPLPHLFDQLRRRYLEDVRITLHQMALSNESGMQPFVHVRNDPGISSFKIDTANTSVEKKIITVPVFKLDDVLDRKRRVDYIKLDVEGSELMVLQGATETLAAHRPVIVFEHQIAAFKPYGDTSEQLWNLLSSTLDYKIATIQGWLEHKPSLTKGEFLAEVELGKVVDFLAYHPSSTAIRGY